MEPFYLDSSALVKRYSAERGTAWVVSLTNPATGHALCTVWLTRVEMVSALHRKVRTGEVAPADAQRAEARFAADWRRQYRVMEVTAGIVEHAALLARQYPLRGYDAVHLAAAIALDAQFQAVGERVVLVSADQGQLRAAVSEGMVVEDPNDH